MPQQVRAEFAQPDRDQARQNRNTRFDPKEQPIRRRDELVQVKQVLQQIGKKPSDNTIAAICRRSRSKLLVNPLG
ncbi:MAG: hypothetical protein R3B90_08435 [Planctomycetaceae bacterium]